MKMETSIGRRQRSTLQLEPSAFSDDTVVDINSKTATGPESRTTRAQTTRPQTLRRIKRARDDRAVNTILTKGRRLADSLNSHKGSIGEAVNIRLYNKAGLLEPALAMVDSVANGKGSIGSWWRTTPVQPSTIRCQVRH